VSKNGEGTRHAKLPVWSFCPTRLILRQQRNIGKKAGNKSLRLSSECFIG
jgi:hypothetical protein